MVVAGFSDGSEIGSINMTSGGIAWVTTMEGDELEHPDDKVTIVEQGEAGQDFNSIESMLKWAIGKRGKFPPLSLSLDDLRCYVVILT